MKRARAFTLVEILIVVVLLGVLAAIVVPSFSNATTPAKESALASDLGLLRRFVLIYASQHLEVAPGYPGGNPAAAPTDAAFRDQAMLSSDVSGQTAAVGTPGFPYGPYLSRIPANPFNGKDTVEMLANGQAFPAAADDSHGWICKPQTGEIRPDNTGSTGRGVAYYDF
ncbi:MAG: prepilin-type N-terminal cleavage/methylation domain-containing protein [Sedimentisphaerales bacterium]|nr:prepilin-type N-terminal cleavage/methylation domain-containing protein [Sedimentisphaerales bacterium]